MRSYTEIDRAMAVAAYAVLGEKHDRAWLEGDLETADMLSGLLEDIRERTFEILLDPDHPTWSLPVDRVT